MNVSLNWNSFHCSEKHGFSTIRLKMIKIISGLCLETRPNKILFVVFCLVWDLKRIERKPTTNTWYKIIWSAPLRIYYYSTSTRYRIQIKAIPSWNIQLNTFLPPLNPFDLDSNPDSFSRHPLKAITYPFLHPKSLIHT